MKKIKLILSNLKTKFQDNSKAIVKGFILWVVFLIIYNILADIFGWGKDLDFLVGFLAGILFEDVAKFLKKSEAKKQ